MLRRILIVAAGTVFLMSNSPSNAGNSLFGGNFLYDNCQNAAGSIQEMLCTGYIVGIADVLLFNNPVNGYSACLPSGINIEQLKDIAVMWLRDHPENRHYGAVGLVARALQDAFPC